MIDMTPLSPLQAQELEILNITMWDLGFFNRNEVLTQLGYFPSSEEGEKILNAQAEKRRKAVAHVAPLVKVYASAFGRAFALQKQIKSGEKLASDEIAERMEMEGLTAINAIIGFISWAYFHDFIDVGEPVD